MNQIGDNVGTVDFAAEETARLQHDYAYLEATVIELELEAGKVPLPLTDDAGKADVMSLIKKGRDQKKAIEGLHELEKLPHLRRGTAVDNFFFRLQESLFKRSRHAKSGSFDMLQDELTAYDNRVLAAEQERRRLEAEKAAREAAERDRIAREEQRKAEEARLAAERARLEATKQAKGAVADAAAVQAATAHAEATTAADKAEEAYIGTLAKPADIMRSRGSDGTLGTMKREPYAEVVDAAKLDMATLWPFISLDAKEKALRAWAKTTSHTKQMDGAAIGFRNKSQVR